MIQREDDARPEDENERNSGAYEDGDEELANGVAEIKVNGG